MFLYFKLPASLNQIKAEIIFFYKDLLNWFIPIFVNQKSITFLFLFCIEFFTNKFAILLYAPKFEKKFQSLSRFKKLWHHTFFDKNYDVKNPNKMPFPSYQNDDKVNLDFVVTEIYFSGTFPRLFENLSFFFDHWSQPYQTLFFSQFSGPRCKA